MAKRSAATGKGCSMAACNIPAPVFDGLGHATHASMERCRPTSASIQSDLRVLGQCGPRHVGSREHWRANRQWHNDQQFQAKRSTRLRGARAAVR